MKKKNRGRFRFKGIYSFQVELLLSLQSFLFFFLRLEILVIKTSRFFFPIYNLIGKKEIQLTNFIEKNGKLKKIDEFFFITGP